jgi:Flp pilus assembly protein TadD
VAPINRGNAHKGKGEYEQAIADYSKAIELAPKDADAYNNRGYAYDVAQLEGAIRKARKGRSCSA